MSHWTQEAHPMCICGPMTFGEVKGTVTREGCREHAKAIYGIDPHPILSAEDMDEIMAQFRKRLGVTA
jgi:hypothetical protein